ncbi:quinoprotein dehydrogenase-associated SoxYZ-like carrier [Thauera sp.]|jgi:sulfur-oxidizing protein SoxY|uniref:quinoprotein dehydrogenase-associated SoxYZ-like carrier n=1 Tax=Thauera sp. TaxID=1905334 RepID=UPI001A596E4F|nr:quinoprotein dehydrogenase-associated SoxYZ-like carrier [Thauera sp.]MBL8465339.1 quinoprotein dehydrogenase-associated SoxYZ-like carrier [Thauera sp.]HRO37654.1 quinoprotein dehydrogenase-associated SoxYZ-like carrier [Thauera sp.]
MRLLARPALAWITAALTALAAPTALAAAPNPSTAITPASSTPAVAHPGTQADPLDSPRWEDMRKTFFADARVVFDERIKVSGPAVAEDSLNVPVTVDASAVPGVEELIVFADFNPIVKALRFEPGAAQPRLGFRIKLQQSSPVRAAARTADGVWRIGGAWITATGGGCTLPSIGSGSPEWQERLNEVSGKLWPRIDGGERLRMRIIHPMDTGLAAGIPAFHIDDIVITDAEGRTLSRIQPLEPVSENPSFTLDLRAAAPGARLHVAGRDNNGNRIDAWVTR